MVTPSTGSGQAPSRLFVLVPVYNEQATVEGVLSQLDLLACPESFDGVYPEGVGAQLIAPLQKKGPLAGKKLLFTGSLLAMERSAAEKLVEEKGGEIASGVTQDLDYLVVGDGGGAGSKLEKAEKLKAKGGKVEILSEAEWKKKMGM